MRATFCGAMLCGWLWLAQGVWAQQYLGPSALAVAPDGQRLYVACADAQGVLWVSLPGGRILRRLSVPGPATGITLDSQGRCLYVTCGSEVGAVLQIDAETGQVLQTFGAGHTPMAPVLDMQHDRLYICNRFNNDVSVLRPSDGQLIARVPVPREPVAAALTPDGKRLVVANHLPHRSADPAIEYNVNAVVSVVDTQTWATRNIELYNGASGLRGVCVSPDGRYALATHLLSNFQSIPFRVDMGWINVNVVSVIDLQSLKARTAIGLDELQEGVANPWGICCSADGAAWVACAGTHQVSRMMLDDLVGDTARKTMSPLPGAWPVYPSLGESMWRRTVLPGKGPRAIASYEDRVYVAEYYSDAVAVVRCTGDREFSVESIPLGPQPQLTQVRRGQMLFDDATICYQQWQSCASCHPDGRTDALNWDLMNDGAGNPKNSKSMLFAHQTPPAMIKGVRENAEVAVRSGLTHILFAYRPEAEAEAIDAYLKTLQPIPSPHLEEGQLSAAAQRGQALFESQRVSCQRCHPAPYFTDMQLHRMGRTPSQHFKNEFDTPTLREVWRTAPYLHDGQFSTVQQLLREGRHGLKRDLQLTEQEIEDLTQYVLSL